MRRGLWIEESKKARKEGGRCLDLEHILTDDSCAKKAVIFHERDGADWPVLSPHHRGNSRMYHVHLN